MPQVSIEINGRPYRLNCGEGEEEHVIALSRRIDAHARTLGAGSPPAADARVLVMAALMVADELSEAEGKVAALESEVKALKEGGATPPDERVEDMERAFAQMLDRATDQIEQVARDLEETL